MGVNLSCSSSMSVRLLTAAIEELEALYLLESQSCIALALSRHYRMLAQTGYAFDDHCDWIKQAKYWWQVYLKQCTGKHIDVLLYRPDSGAMFELITP